MKHRKDVTIEVTDRHGGFHRLEAEQFAIVYDDAENAWITDPTVVDEDGEERFVAVFDRPLSVVSKAFIAQKQFLG